jgi:hypothetical protein
MTPSDDRLLDDLAALRDEVAWPPTPDFALPALEPLRTARRARPFTRARLVVAVGLLLVLAVAAVPPARSAVAELLGLEGGEEIRRVPELPPAPPRTSPEQAPGRATTLRAARRAVRFPVRLPRALGAPDGVRVWDGLPGRAVILTYGDRTALWAFEGSSARFVEKLVTQATTVRRVRVGRAPAIWLRGAPHTFLAAGTDGVPVETTAATVDADVLVWHAGGLAYRLETREGLARALAIARSVTGRPG